MHQHVGVSSEIEAGDPVRADVETLPAEVRLMVGEIDEHTSLGLDAVADGRSGVQDGLRRDRRLADRPGLVGDVVERDVRRCVREEYRKERWREEPGDSRAQRLAFRGRPPDVQLRLGLPQGDEESEPFEVVEVQVRQHEVDRPAARTAGELHP